MAIALTALTHTPAPSADPLPARQAELLHLLRHDCGSCHGLRLQGGLGPALTPASLHTRPAPLLKAVILRGSPGTPMAPWRGLLSAADAQWLVETMKRGLPEARANR
ncbi:MAG: c-type cytochrome [Gammaproteobacteria bacterium]